MKKIFRFVVFLLILLSSSELKGQNNGEELFKSICSACHTINKGRLVGPDLTGVYNKMPQEWLIGFIRSSQQMVKSGDPDAVAIFNEYNKVPMPDNNLTDDQILSIIDYIKTSDQGAGKEIEPSKSADTTAVVPGKGDSIQSPVRPDSLPVTAQVQPDSTSLAFSEEKVNEGRALFYGLSPFVNKGSPCISCHNIKDRSVLGGGKLALDLTYSYSKLSPAGIQGILTNPPFPAMKAAMQNHPLTPAEIENIVALLKSSDDRSREYPIRQSGGIIFATIGIVAALFFMVHIFIFYDDRKIPNV